MKGFDLMAVLLNAQFSEMLLHGLKLTLVIAIGSWVVAMSLAIVLLVVRLLPSRIAERVVQGYISYHQNVPTLVQLMLWYFGVASLLPGALQEWLSARACALSRLVRLRPRARLVTATSAQCATC